MILRKWKLMRKCWSLKDKYGSELSEFFKIMVGLDEDKRLDYEQLLGLINGLNVRNGAKF
jgi:hypothetical protein